MLSDVAMKHTMNPPQLVLAVDSCLLRVTYMICLIRIALHSNSGYSLDPFALVAMTDIGDVLILRRPTLEVLALNISAGLTECARSKVEPKAKSMGIVRFIPRIDMWTYR